MFRDGVEESDGRATGCQCCGHTCPVESARR